MQDHGCPRLTETRTIKCRFNPMDQNSEAIWGLSSSLISCLITALPLVFVMIETEADVCLPLGWYPGHTQGAPHPPLVCEWLSPSPTHLIGSFLSLSLDSALHHSDPLPQVAPLANQTPRKGRNQDYTGGLVAVKNRFADVIFRHESLCEVKVNISNHKTSVFLDMCLKGFGCFILIENWFWAIDLI